MRTSPTAGSTSPCDLSISSCHTSESINFLQWQQHRSAVSLSTFMEQMRSKNMRTHCLLGGDRRGRQTTWSVGATEHEAGRQVRFLGTLCRLQRIVLNDPIGGRRAVLFDGWDIPMPEGLAWQDVKKADQSHIACNCLQKLHQSSQDRPTWLSAHHRAV